MNIFLKENIHIMSSTCHLVCVCVCVCGCVTMALKTACGEMLYAEWFLVSANDGCHNDITGVDGRARGGVSSRYQDIASYCIVITFWL